MNRLNIGLIGYGYIGKIHTLAYRNIPILFIDYQDKYNMSLIISSKLKSVEDTGWKELIKSIDDVEKSKLDIIDICTPNFLHNSQAEFFIDKGINIYCEKPMGLNYIESKNMYKKALDNDVITQVALVYRFMPAIAKAKVIIDNDGIGEIINFRAQLLHSSYINPERKINWRLEKEKSGGGALIDLGIHLVDIINFLFADNKIKSVSAKANTVIKERPEDNSSRLKKVNVDDWGIIFFELENGSGGTIEVSKVSYNPFDSLVIDIYGTKGFIRITDKNVYNPVYKRIDKKDTTKIFEEVEKNNYIKYLNTIYPSAKMSMGSMVDMHIASLLNMINNVLARKVNYDETPTFKEGVKSQKLIDLANQSIENGGKRIIL